MNERVLSIHFHSFSKHVLGVYFCAGHRYVWSIKQGLETHYFFKVGVAYINQRITHTSNYKLWKVLWCKRRGWKKEHVTVNWPSLGVRESFLYMGYFHGVSGWVSPKADPKTRIWAQVTYFRVDSRKLCEWVGKWDGKDGKPFMKRIEKAPRVLQHRGH